MTVETQIQSARQTRLRNAGVDEMHKRKRRTSQAVEEIFPYEPYQDPLKEPMRDFHSKNDNQFEHKGFEIQREPMYQLWRVTKDNKPVKGLESLYTAVNIAHRAIDEYLKQLTKAIEKKTKNGNKAKNNQTPNG